jgi:cation transport protein ChaC
VPEARADATFEQLTEREGSSYVPREAPVKLDDGRRITATVWVNDRNDRTYLGDKPLDERVQLASETAGERGTAREYVRETRASLREHDIDDPAVEQFAEQVCGTM